MSTWCVHVHCIAMISHFWCSTVWVKFDRDIAIDKLQSDLGIWGLVWKPYRDSSQPKVSPTAQSRDEPDGRFGTQLDNLHLEVQRLEVENDRLLEERPEMTAEINWESWYCKETGCLVAEIQELWQLLHPSQESEVRMVQRSGLLTNSSQTWSK